MLKVIPYVVSYSMTKREKLLAKLLELPTEMRYSDIIKILENHDFYFTHAGKNHNLFSNGTDNLNIPTKSGKMVKRVYLQRILETLGYQREQT